jgi:small-conductance mechanosensitive channel
MRTNIIILLSLMATCVLAQPDLVESVPNAPPPTTINDAPQEGVNLPPVSTDLVPTKSSQEVWLSLGVLLFGMVVILAQAFLISKREEPLSESLKYLGVTLIIVGSLFLVTAGYGNSQIAPIIGLLGTVAGYLLGRTQPTTK